MHSGMTHLTLLGALVITNAMLRRLTNWRLIIIIIIIIRGRLGRSAPPILIFGPHHISKINAARKLKFGTLVVIYE